MAVDVDNAKDRSEDHVTGGGGGEGQRGYGGRGGYGSVGSIIRTESDQTLCAYYGRKLSALKGRDLNLGHVTAT